MDDSRQESRPLPPSVAGEPATNPHDMKQPWKRYYSSCVMNQKHRSENKPHAATSFPALVQRLLQAPRTPSSRDRTRTVFQPEACSHTYTTSSSQTPSRSHVGNGVRPPLGHRPIKPAGVSRVMQATPLVGPISDSDPTGSYNYREGDSCHNPDQVPGLGPRSGLRSK